MIPKLRIANSVQTLLNELAISSRRLIPFPQTVAGGSAVQKNEHLAYETKQRHRYLRWIYWVNVMRDFPKQSKSIIELTVGESLQTRKRIDALKDEVRILLGRFALNCIQLEETVNVRTGKLARNN